MTNGTSSFERRITTLLGAIADQMPAEIDAMAMSRLAAGGRTAGVRVPGAPVHSLTRLGLVGLVLALVVVLVGGALLAGRLLEQRPVELFPPRVFPGIGLPPEGAPPSEPASGELLLAIAARISALGHEVHVGYLYADGRMIWQRNLEGHKSAQSVFGDIQPTRALIEQRLTPEGVDMIWNDAFASRMPEKPGRNGAGTTVWGSIDLNIHGTLMPMAWSDGSLPRRLADPGSWLSGTAWADRTLRAYVPSRYAVCLTPGVELVHLPRPAADALRGGVGSTGPGNPYSVGTCYEVPTEVAREIAATLGAAGFERDGHEDWHFGYLVAPKCCPDVDLARFPLPGVRFLEVLPHGEFFQRGG